MTSSSLPPLPPRPPDCKLTTPRQFGDWIATDGSLTLRAAVLGALLFVNEGGAGDVTLGRTGGKLLATLLRQVSSSEGIGRLRSWSQGFYPKYASLAPELDGYLNMEKQPFLFQTLDQTLSNRLMEFTSGMALQQVAPTLFGETPVGGTTSED